MPFSSAYLIILRMNEGTQIMVLGCMRLMVSHCNSGMPLPTRITLAPILRMPKK